jgi:hypothetical protein
MFGDALSKTVALIIVSSWLIFTQRFEVQLPLFILGGIVAFCIGVPRSVLVFLLVAPALQIAVSYFVIEPTFANKSLDFNDVEQALHAWLRVVGLIFFTVSWLKSMTLFEGVRLSKLVWLGQYILIPALVMRTSLVTAGQRLTIIRELSTLSNKGQMPDRRKLRIKKFADIGMQLFLSTIGDIPNIALSCTGRGIATRRSVKVDNVQVSLSSGLMNILLCALMVTDLWLLDN